MGEVSGGLISRSGIGVAILGRSGGSSSSVMKKNTLEAQR